MEPEDTVGVPTRTLPMQAADAYRGTVTGDAQKVTVFSAGVATKAARPEEAKALIRYLSSEKARPTIEKTGLEPMAAN